MAVCLFASDLHGRPERYRKLFEAIESRRPAAVFLGGDLLPSGLASAFITGTEQDDFLDAYLASEFRELRARMGKDYPAVFAILGNDDARIEEASCKLMSQEGLWSYIHERRSALGRHDVYGYSYVPPTPFLLKDWERYDVSRFTPVGCVSPEEGGRTVEVAPNVARYSTIKDDLDRLAGDNPMKNAVFLFHSPPHETSLDRAGLDGKAFEGVPLDLHVGSIAIQRFIHTRQPLLTLHGHIHESARLTGSWRERAGRTHMFSAAHDGPELALVSFDLGDLENARRELL